MRLWRIHPYAWARSNHTANRLPFTHLASSMKWLSMVVCSWHLENPGIPCFRINHWKGGGSELTLVRRSLPSWQKAFLWHLPGYLFITLGGASTACIAKTDISCRIYTADHFTWLGNRCCSDLLYPTSSFQAGSLVSNPFEWNAVLLIFGWLPRSWVMNSSLWTSLKNSSTELVSMPHVASPRILLTSSGPSHHLVVATFWYCSSWGPFNPLFYWLGLLGGNRMVLCMVLGKTLASH